MIHTIVTDLDWVLFDSVKVYKEAIWFAAKILWKEISHEEINKHIASRETFEAFFWDQKAKAYQIFHEYCKEEETWEKFNMFPWVKDSLEQLQSSWINIFAFTDRTRKATEVILGHHWLSEIFRWNFISRCCTWVKKPSPTWLNKIMLQNQLSAQNIVYIWDTHNDFTAWKLAWVQFIWVNSWINSKNDWDNMWIANIDFFPNILEILQVNR